MGMQHFSKGNWKDLTLLQICIIMNMKLVLLSVIRPANTYQDAIYLIYKTLAFVK
jgi:hypothetical protein